MSDDATVSSLAGSLVAALAAAGRSVATAESCTGGWIAKAITDVPGSSAVFAYGVVSYSNDAKERLLGVDGRILESDGAVSEAAVRAMAEGAAGLSGADLAVAVSGIAGPDGGSEQKPVGTVWFAWTRRGEGGLATDAEKETFTGDRASVRRQSVAHALRGLGERLGA